MMTLAGSRVTVMGLGLHGGAIGTIRWLAAQGAKITVTDLKGAPELATSLQQLQDLPHVRYVLGEHRAEDFTNTNLVVRNPSVPRSSQWLALARKNKVPIEMDSSLFFLHSPSSHVIGVTGSKGKSTATQALAHLLQLKYPQTVTIGNDGQSPLGALPHIKLGTLVIFELSSWRLEALAPHNVSPATAVVTSLYQDHLNTYDSFEEYIETKKTIIRYQKSTDVAILNADDDRVRQWGKECRGQVYWYSTENHLPHQAEGIYVDRGTITVRLRRTASSLFPLKSLPLSSDHERRNLLPAILLGFMAGIPVASLELQMRNFSGLAHRLEKVRVLRHVTYINDSAATMPDATIAALQAMGNQHVVHILGGSDKKLNFEKLAALVSQRPIRAFIFLPGDATPRLQRQILGQYRKAPPYYLAETMAEAVTKAAEQAQPQDIVLLSPAATSFGLFKHEFDRGDQFKAAVNELPA